MLASKLNPSNKNLTKSNVPFPEEHGFGLIYNNFEAKPLMSKQVKKVGKPPKLPPLTGSRQILPSLVEPPIPNSMSDDNSSEEENP